MKARKDKRLTKYDEESYLAFTKHFSNYFQSYFSYCWGWMPSFCDTETPVSSHLPDEAKERRDQTK
ncbi:hypothetical protein [Sinanaerobacter sp. ZZT-01]|uniref:hypothetical protein n=1 Tax=Sinanaerobacter sp. ZZT-01 TaxID=3111540 RepID=UPI002D79D76C|nr:hypothetical protein [Sinanaerobacter sp. ZZT-01]WRR93810.1 hypothetical protein U5921_01410 [Sinanaerobacter sp. ZZT-01]